MATLDISIVVFALMVVLILDILAIGLASRWFAMFGFIFALSSLGYFILNFNVVGIGTGITIPFEIFITSWVVLPILVSFVLIITKGRSM